MKKIKSFFYIMLCVLLTLGCGSLSSAADSAIYKEIRVGFFSADGYHVMNDEGIKSGYGYDFLQMMLRYNNWKYDYVGYDKNWPDMLDMLDRGEIDIVTLANKTTEREKKYAFSDKSIGTSSTIMTISEKNTEVIPGDYSTYDGTTIGLVEGSSHNEYFLKYAEKKGFQFKAKYYEEISELLKDLRAGKNIDIAVTSNMRILQSETVLDEFNATEYYAVVRKEDTELLGMVNYGISQLDVNSPNWKSALHNKYYNDINSKVISFTTEERNYLSERKENDKTVIVAMNPELRPYSYFEKGKARGIAPTLFREIADRLDIKYKILYAKDRWEYKEQLKTGKADLDLTAYLDYSLAQKNNLKETDAYINSTMAMLSRNDSETDNDKMTVAVVKDPTEYIGYNNELINKYKHKEYNSIQECIDAVKNGEVDATFRYVYIAERAVTEDYTNKLQYTILTDYAFSLSIGVDDKEDCRLLSILNKGVNSLTTEYIQSVMLEESSRVKQHTSIIAMTYEYPLVVIIAIVVFATIIVLLILLVLRNRSQKVKLLASNEMQRFIGYICEVYEVVVEINLKKKKRIVYSMEDGKLVEVQKEHEPFTKEYFVKRVPEEDVDRMTDIFSNETINKMIDEGGSQNYTECQIRGADGTYKWYSYIIKAVPRDQEHPANLIIFKKNIHETKMGEDEQKQILQDALETAKSASSAKGQFLSKMSHEIRTPLNAVIGYMEIAKDAKENPSKMMHCIENSDVAAKHLLSIINDVLDISSIESGKMKIAHEEFDLKRQITALSTIFFNQAKEKKVNFEVTLNDISEEWVVGDTLRLNQILMNLLSNAVKFTPENGKITLSVTQVKEDSRRVFMTFGVKDTGIGMSGEYQKRLFKPFEQESAATAQKYGGSGLGLSITFNLVKMMGGSIEVESKQGVGSEFLVSIHFDRSTSNHENTLVRQDYSHVRALIVDDDKGTCKYVQSLLKRCNVKSDMVYGGEAAIRRIQGRKGTDYEYNMCIMDWNMPGLNGIETARRIKEECEPDIPIIIATAYDVTEVEEEAMEVGIQKVIAKPLFQSTMFDLLVSTYGRYMPQKSVEQNLESIQGMRVLLAEDNPMNLEIAMEILKKAGLVIDAVSDGKQAYDKFIASEKGSYDVILMDVQMPVMDGYTATGEIRKSNHPEAKSIPIIAMTANAFAEDVNDALASGMNGHISKPVNYEKLYEVLNRFAHKEGES